MSAAQMRSGYDFPDPASLASQLRQLQHSVNEQNVQELRAALPAAWHVRTPESDYSVSTAPLRELLDASSSKTRRSAGIADAQEWLAYLADQLEGYAGADAASSKARTNLQHILARPEFAGDGPPSAWDRFRERMAANIVRWLARLFVFAGEHPTGGRAVFWIAVAGAVGLLGFWLVRLWSRERYNLKLQGSPHPVPVGSWEQWLHAARAASNEGDIHNAIQCAYWTGVARLQESGALPGGLIHTPREYLRLLSTPQWDQIDNAAALDPLRMLTSHLERFWYVRAGATRDDFSACLGSLEALGCKVD